MTNWKPTKLGEVLTPVSRPQRLDPTTEYRLLGVRLDGAGPFLRETKLGSQIAAATLSRVEDGDFIYSRLFAWRGAFGIISEDLDGCHVSGEFPTFAANPNKLDPKFLRYWFRRPTTLETVVADCTGSTPLTRNRFKEEFFLALEIPLPALAEQRRIVARIEQLANQIEEARRLRHQTTEETGAIIGAVTTRVFDTLTACDQVPLGALGPSSTNPIQTGPFGSQLLKSEFVEDGVPVLNVGNVQPEGLDLSSLDHVLPDKAETLSRYALREGDLLFARTGATLGKVCLLPAGCDDWLMTGHLFRVRLDRSRCEPPFAFAGLRAARSVRDQVFGQVRGATRPGFNTALLSQVCLPLPPLLEQRRIVEYLDGLAGQVAALTRLQSETAAELDALLPSILDKAFKGEL